ncbi:MAG: RagB/SusD family nutrient uptake outer membrane protein [Spirosomataceae bacterium]
MQALIARYALMAGDNEKALAASNRVDLTVRSLFNFDDNAQNPIFFTAFSNRNVTEPVNGLFNLPAALVAPTATDRRLAFYFRPTTSATLNLGLGFFTANNAAIPVYLAGEMLLIRAEVNARKGDLPTAIVELNKVLTKTPTTADPVGAGLTAYTGANTADAILTEIYRQRCMELFMSGMRLEDTRRFGRPAAGATGSERNRNWYPYPLIERTNNRSTPDNPTD